jgi:GDP-L-fucose synthase
MQVGNDDMNILITGSDGFIGRNLSQQLKQFGHNIYCINKNSCNLLDQSSVDNFFRTNNTRYNLIIHTAIEGGRRTKIDNPDIVYNNLLMLYNLLSYQSYYECIISFGSGAELDRRYDINSHSINRYPIDPYGLSKSIIDKLCVIEDKLCNFRLYNCFGVDEQPDRMIRANIIRYLNKENIIIQQNRRMDFFYIDDLGLLIHSLISCNNIPKIHDCCYAEKYDLFQIAEMINHLDNHKVDIIIEEPGLNKDYTGISAKINIKYIGLKQALNIMYNKYKEINI